MCRATLLESILATARQTNVEVTFEKRLVHIEDRPDQPVVAHFADGSVRWIANSIDLTTWFSLQSRNDALPVDD